jgi:glucose/arabinose dehydrogenase
MHATGVSHAGLCCGLIFAASTARAVPAGFVDEVVASGLRNPTAMAFAPDGRLVVTEQGGTARIVVGGVLQTTPFATMSVDSRGERGLLGVAFHPNFASNRYVYFYRTMPAAAGRAARNRITRFTVSRNAVVASSAVTIVEFDDLTDRSNHNGGAITFGKDGKLYVAVGDNGDRSNARSLANRLGKILRLNDNGTVPSDIPTTFPGISGRSSGANRAIWALGLRNAFSFAIHPQTGAMIINDVGENRFEELNRGGAGRNYGWPSIEGPSSTAGLTGPLYAYRHGSGTPRGCAVTGGAFYSAQNARFPASYVGRYFFADYCGNWIYHINPASPGTATAFATGLSAPVGLAVSSDGALYYVQRGNGQLRRIRYTGNAAQRIVVSDADLTIAEGSRVGVSVRLANAPSSDVVVNVDPTLSDYLISGSPKRFVFTRSNWSTPQRLLITSQHDGDTVDEGARFSLWLRSPRAQIARAALVVFPVPPANLVGLPAGIVPSSLRRRILPRRVARFCAFAPSSLSPTAT